MNKFAILLLLIVVPCWSSTLNPKRVRFIERTPAQSGLNNWLFRGNEPLTSDHKFAYDDLKKYMNAKAKEETNSTLPSDFYLIDVNFLDPLEESDTMAEEKFFEENSSLGEVIHWMIVGSLVNPEIIPEAIRKLWINDFDFSIDDLKHRIPKLHDMLYSNGTKPVVIYIHCEAGVDRTGEVSGSYYMQYQGMNFSQALFIDDHIEDRNISTPSKYGLQWYCYTLKYLHKYNISCESE